jgi:hypothetical protein
MIPLSPGQLEQGRKAQEQFELLGFTMQSFKAAIGPRLGQGAELPARIHDALDDGEQVEGRAGETVYPRHRHHIAGDDVVQELQKLTAVGLGAAVAVELCAPVGAKLVELRVLSFAPSAPTQVSSLQYAGQRTTDSRCRLVG